MLRRQYKLFLVGSNDGKSKKVSSQELKFEQAAQWIIERGGAATAQDLIQALKSLSATAQSMETDCLLSQLFPLTGLEVLFSKELDVAPVPVPSSTEPPSTAALTAIGEAICREMDRTGKGIFTLSVPDLGSAAVFRPSHRDAVLLGSNTTLV